MPAIHRLQARTQNPNLRFALSIADRVISAARSIASSINDFDDPFGGGGACACAQNH